MTGMKRLRGSALMQAAAGVKPAGMMGYVGGRPAEMPVTDAAPSGLQAAVQDALSRPMAGAGRGADLAGLQRRKLRAAELGITDLRQASPEQIAGATWRGLLPRSAGQRSGPQEQRSAGSQLANIRWHGHPNGPEAALSALDAARRGRVRRDPFADVTLG